MPLSNYVNVTEQPRIEHVLRQASGAKHGADVLPFRHGESGWHKGFRPCVLHHYFSPQ